MKCPNHDISKFNKHIALKASVSSLSHCSDIFTFAGDGKIGHSNQGNNMYLFPGLAGLPFSALQSLLFCFLLIIFWSCRIGLGTLLSGARVISDGMLQAAAEWYSCSFYAIFLPRFVVYKVLIYLSPFVIAIPPAWLHIWKKKRFFKASFILQYPGVLCSLDTISSLNNAELNSNLLRLKSRKIAGFRFQSLVGVYLFYWCYSFSIRDLCKLHNQRVTDFGP